ncbi:MAG TPA: hypothetical protein VH024_05265 [Candidatus Angelobacter sp.]|jgi:hypothetical protein|nr:hypothetical protein [Candidatus Angelobacter sp.]
MKKWITTITLLCLCWAGHSVAENAEPKWRVNLRERYEFQAFDRTINFRWTLHQDVLFISPDRVLVYQVNRTRGPAHLGPRDASGGAGNFTLAIRVLNAHDGKKIKSLDLPTSAEFSKVIATRDGQFIVRTGDILYLYSANFEKLASKPLPLKRVVLEEGWQIGVSPSGDEVALVHQQIFKRNHLSATSRIEKAEADVEVLSADNLETIKSFSLPWILPDNWHAADHALLSPNPTTWVPTATFGLLDFSGQWSPLIPDWASPEHPCAYQATPLEHKLFAAFGCGNLSVFPQTGEKLFSLKTGTKDFVGSVLGGGDYLAVQWERRYVRIEAAANIPIAVAEPLRLDLYGIRNVKPLLSVSLHSGNIYYSVSSRGEMAVVDGTSLNLYSAAH